MTTAKIFTFTHGMVTVGIPVSRGGAAILSSFFQAYESPPHADQWKEATSGFFRGLLYPLPFMIFHGDELDIHEKSHIFINRVDHDYEEDRSQQEKLYDTYTNAGLIKKYN